MFIKDIGPFNDTIIEFNQQFTVIAGINGSGKSLIAKLIANCLTQTHLHNIRSNSGNGEYWIEVFEKERLYGIGVPIGYFKSMNEYMKTGKIVHVKPPKDFNESKLEAFIFPDHIDNLINIEKLKLGQLSRSKYIDLTFTPLLMGPFRYISYKGIDGPKKDADTPNSRINYRKNAYLYLSTSILPDVKQWIVTRFINKLANFAWAKIQSQNFDYIMSRLDEVVPPGDKLELLELTKDYEVQFCLNSQTVYLEELSGGYQSILSLVFSIINWLELIHMGDEQNIENAFGTVVIDEIDAHLHPIWQLQIVHTLKNLFPNLQFILTTHSPHILASCEKSEIITLSQKGEYKESDEQSNTDRTIIKPFPKSFQGWDYLSLLEELMKVDNLFSRPYEKLIRDADNAYEEKNIDRLEQIFVELKEISHPSDTIIEIIDIRINRLKSKLKIE